MPTDTLMSLAEESARSNIAMALGPYGSGCVDAGETEATTRMLDTCANGNACENAGSEHSISRARKRTRGATYAYDGSLEGMFTAIHAAFCAGDAAADILEADILQPRIGQEVVDVTTTMDDALKVRRLIEHALGAHAFHSIRTAASTEEPSRGTVVYRFLRYAISRPGIESCTGCPDKSTCTRACTMAGKCTALDELARPEVSDLVALYRSAINERHLMLQFMRFEHCEGDVWFARCNPKANVVPLLMDWFIPRFNDQKFVIYDENHGMSGVYDGARWYLVKGDDVTPPPHMEDERMMREAWRRFYRSLSVEDRYNPELRRHFMPMRLWRNLPELA